MFYLDPPNPRGLLGWLLVGCLALAAAPVTAQTWAPYFGNTHFGFSTGNTTNGRSPAAVEFADLDGDGDLDAVVAQAGYNTGFSGGSTGFAVLLNQGDGFFGPPTQHPSGFASRDVVVADFTGDGELDVVVTNTGDNFDGTTVALFPGLGTGQFGPDTTLPVGVGPVGLVTADFDGNGRPDLAVANYGFGFDSTVTVLYNQPSGAFTAQTIPAGVASYQLAVGQLNGDALPDLVVSNDSQGLHVLLNSASGFQQNTAYQMLTTNWAGDLGSVVALADLEGDGDLDVCYSSNRTWDGNNGQIAIRRNTGAGVLDTLELVTLENYSVGASSLVMTDVNGDGRPDIVAPSPSGRTGDGYRVALNLGTGTFGPTVVRSAGQFTSTVQVAEINGDSLPDIFTLDDYSMELTVHRNKGGGQFPTPTLYTAGLPTLAGTLEAGDVNGDGFLDLVTSSNQRTAVAVGVAVLLNTGTGTFAPGVSIATAGVQAKLRDLDGDGDLDLLYTGGTGVTGYNFLTALNDGTGTFAVPQLWQVGVCAPEDIDAADMDNDGDLDVVASGGCGSEIYISHNLGAATFDSAVVLPASTFGGPLALADLNEDGFLDIISGSNASADVLLSDGAGGYTGPSTITLDQSPFDILAADLNDDGHVDIASCNYGADPGDYSMTVRMGVGDGTFGSLTLLPAAYSPDLANVSGIAAGDIDDDGDLDLMVSNNATNDMSIYLNQGGGLFSAALRAGLYYGARTPWFADFNNDGHCELAALVDLPPGGFQSALLVLDGAASGQRTAGTAPLILGAPAPAVAVAGPRLQAAPNPVTTTTRLTFTMRRAGMASLTIYNALGQEVAQPLPARPVAAGPQTVTFSRGTLPAGVYVARLTTPDGASRALRLVLD